MTTELPTAKRRRIPGARFRLLVPVILAGWLGAAVPPTDSPSQGDPSPGEIDEGPLLGAEARGDFAGARRGYRDAFLQALGTSDAGSNPEKTAALAEYFLARYLHLARTTSAAAEVRETLLEVYSREPIDPIIRGWAGMGLADSALRLGHDEEAARISASLGFVTDWLICGPFDNERGGGFETVYPPEQEFLRDGTYQGKKRKVRWVPVPASDPLAWIDLDEMLRPNDECLAYATTAVRSPKEQSAAIRIGSDEGIKVWVNGRLVLAKDVYRSARHDQNVAGVVLREGWNRILLKVAERKDAWRFALRITDLEGRPLSSLEVSTDPGPVEDAREVPPEPPRPRLGAISSLEGRRGEGDDPDAPDVPDATDAMDLFRLGVLHLMRQPGGEEDHTDRDLLARARKLDPKSAIYPYYHSLALRVPARYSVARDHNLEREALEKAFSLDPEHSLAAYSLARYYFRSLRNRHKALSWVKRALEGNQTFARARLLLADLHEDRRWLEEARIERQAIVQETGEGLAALVALARSSEAAGEMQTALHLLEQAHAVDRTDRVVRRGLGRIYGAVGEPKKSIALWREAARLRPFATRHRIEVAQLLDGLDDLDGAIGELRAALRIAPEDDEILDRLGRLLSRKGEDGEAERVWRKALAFNPTRVELRRYLEFRSEEARPFEEAFPFDAERLIDLARSEPEEGNEPYRVILRRMIVRVNRDGTHDEFHHEIYKIGNDDGARAFDRYRIPYSSGEQHVKVKAARVIHPDGSEEAARIGRQGRPRRGGEFSTRSSRSVDLPNPSPGDLVEIRYRRDDLEQSFFGDYFGDVFVFQDRVPVARASYTLIAPKDRKFYFHVKNADLTPQVEEGEDGMVISSWEMTGVPKLEAEPGRPPSRESSPQIEVSTFQDWKDLASWYGDLIRSQHQANDPIREKVDELTGGLDAVEEKIRAIYEFVVTEVRYNDAWEFGVHGYKPYKAATIFTRKFGDCKDKSILLNTMLREIGVSADPVLIFSAAARGREDLTLPMFNHFNHCISWVSIPGTEEGIFLDGTAQYHPWESIPSSDQGAEVLVVQKGGGSLQQVPLASARANRMSSRHDVELSPDGSARIRVVAEAHADFAIALRAALPLQERRAEQLERIYAESLPGTRVESTRFSDLKLLADPVRVQFEMTSPAFVHETPEGSALLPIGNLLFPYTYAKRLSDLVPLDTRKTDLLLPTPTEIVDEVEVLLPEGTQVISLPEDRDISSVFGTFTSKSYTEAGKIHISRTLTLHSRRVTVEEYAKFRKFCNDVDRARGQEAVVRLQKAADK